MNVNFTKLISSAAAVLAVGSSAYAQQKSCAPTPAPCCFEQGYEICNDKFPAAYNASARIDVQCSWDFFATASFIYWHADQESMDLAFPYDVTGFPHHDEILVQKFEYKPGFKVGLGMDFDHDNWVGFVEYTWFHQETSLGTADAPAGRSWAMTSWYNNFLDHISTVKSEWKANLEILDATLSRPYYQGRKLTILPFAGLRGAWIRQNLRIEATSTEQGMTVNPIVSHNRSQSWAVGPRAGLQAHWLLGWGFRMEGDVSGSLLYTRYTKVSHIEDAGTGSSLGSLSYHDYNTLRPMADMGIGFGWGSYFDRQNYHFDLLATYDFNVMWGQNMMRQVTNIVNGHLTSSAAGDLHLQGLTVTARFDF